MVDSNGSGLVFILSTPRAGSTLLGAILGSHSAILCPPEPWLLLPLATARSERILATAAFDYRLAMRAVHEFLPGERFDDALTAFAITAYNAVLANSDKRVLVDKTPRYYQILPALDALFPQALQVWIKRNPLDTVVSCMNTWSLSLEELMGEAISPYTFDMTISFPLLASHFASQGDRKFTLGYEDLVREPQPYLEEICSRVGLRFEPAMLRYRDNEPLMRAYRLASMGDKKILEAPGLHHRSIDRWRAELSPDQVSRVIRTLGSSVFEMLGYAEVLEEACTYAGVQPGSLTAEGDLDRLLKAYQGYGISHARTQGWNNEVPRADVQYTLLGQQTNELQLAAQERLDLIQDLDNQLRALHVDVIEKERVIDELRAASDDRLRLIESLTAEVEVLRQSSGEREVLEAELQTARRAAARRERLEAELRSGQAQARAKERVIMELREAAEQRLQVINQLNEQLRLVQSDSQQSAGPPNGTPTNGEVRLERHSSWWDTQYEAINAMLDEQSAVLADLAESVEAFERTQDQQSARAVEERLQMLQEARATAERLAEIRLNVIEEQRESIRRYRRWRPLEGLHNVLAPRLGVLYQYPPRPLRIPPRYLDVTRRPATLRMSIVTPTRNQAAFIERTVRSVVGQHYSNLEYIVQDGASTDNTMAILEGYAAHFTHCESVSDTGFGNGINRGFAHATGEIMAYLNSDDVLLSGALHHIAHYFEEHPDVDVVYGHRAIIDEYDAEVGRWVLPPHDDEILSWADYVPQETLFWRRGIWEKSGAAIDESFRFAIDWDLLLRFREAGAKMVRLPRFLGGFRIHPHQKTSSEMEHVGVQEMNRLRERCHHRPVSNDEVHRAIQKYLRRHVWRQHLYSMGLLRY